MIEMLADMGTVWLTMVIIVLFGILMVGTFTAMAIGVVALTDWLIEKFG